MVCLTDCPEPKETGPIYRFWQLSSKQTKSLVIMSDSKKNVTIHSTVSLLWIVTVFFESDVIQLYNVKYTYQRSGITSDFVYVSGDFWRFPEDPSLTDHNKEFPAFLTRQTHPKKCRLHGIFLLQDGKWINFKPRHC